LGTLPAAMRSASGEPLIAVPSMNCVVVTTEAIVVNSLTTTFTDGSLPSTESRAMAGLLPPALLTAGVPLDAIRYRIEPPGTWSTETTNRPSPSVGV
jgi:hypothetical protein